MDIKEFTKTMTREQFLSFEVKGYRGGGMCPGSFRLEEFKRGKCLPGTFRNCKKCWDKALKNIKFKGEDEMKKFNWEDRENTVVHCDTEEKAKDFIKECNKRGIKFNTGIDKNYWENHTENICYRLFKNTIVYSGKMFYKNEGYEILEWEIESEPKESTPGPQELFTFQEVIANIKEGEKYVSESRVFSLKEIISHRGMISFNGTFNSEKELHVNNKALFYKEEVKSVHIIHKVKHTPEGTLIDYRNPKGEESINDNVICHTEKGEIYGRRVTSELIKMTEKEYLSYPIIENIND